MPVTAAQQKELAGLARAANRRIERATPGQRSYLESQISKYHVRQRDSGMTVFQQGKAKSEAEYRARMRELEAFMNAHTSTRKGWDKVKQEQVEAAGKTLRDEGADISDDELALILEEIGEGHSSAEFYKALANVEISKAAAGDSWTPNRDAIRNALETRRSDQERTLALLAARGRV